MLKNPIEFRFRSMEQKEIRRTASSHFQSIDFRCKNLRDKREKFSRNDDRLDKSKSMKYSVRFVRRSKFRHKFFLLNWNSFSTYKIHDKKFRFSPTNRCNIELLEFFVDSIERKSNEFHRFDDDFRYKSDKSFRFLKEIFNEQEEHRRWFYPERHTEIETKKTIRCFVLLSLTYVIDLRSTI